MDLEIPDGVELFGGMEPGFEQVITPAALRFVAALARNFTDRVEALLAARVAAQARYDAGELPTFLTGPAESRDGDWKVGPIPADLEDRRVEITGPVDRKMIINALNSGANVFMADFEDSNTPTWQNQVQGQVNLYDAVRRTIRFVNARGRVYALKDKTATLMVRPRGWHLPEAHMVVDGRPVPGGLFDFGLFFFHNARELLARGSGPYFYLPKLQSHLEARLWNDVFSFAQDALEIPRGTIRATMLLETLPAAFEMEEMLYELREHSAGLNCGRWDYIFSTIKTLRAHPQYVMPDRAVVGMTHPFMKAYTERVIQICHRRGAHAMGGMAAQIPIKSDAAANATALEKVRGDKLREVTAGHDGTWVAHPGLVAVAREIFDAHMPTPNQIHRLREDVNVTPGDLLPTGGGPRTEAGLRQNINVGVLYLESWLKGTGCVPLYNLMEDAATAEISRTQLWQWIHHGAALDDGRVVTAELVRATLDDELEKLRDQMGEERFDHGEFERARDLFEQVACSEDFIEFLTLPAYPQVITQS
jgi:malate synthase